MRELFIIQIKESKQRTNVIFNPIMKSNTINRKAI